MKQLLFAVLMTVCSASWAEWEFCSGSGAGTDITVAYYCDKSTIRRNGATSRMWTIKNTSKEKIHASGSRYRSSKILRAYNCREETSATISFVFYSDLMGKGTVVTSGTVEDEREWQWSPIVPDTVSQSLWEIACGLR